MTPYRYTTLDGKVTVERKFPMGKMPLTIRIGNRIARRDYRAEQVRRPDGRIVHAKNWPLTSEALGVHPSQIPEASAQLQKDGVNGRDAHFTDDGSLVLKDRAARNKVLKSLEMHDLDGGYGDE